MEEFHIYGILSIILPMLNHQISNNITLTEYFDMNLANNQESDAAEL